MPDLGQKRVGTPNYLPRMTLPLVSDQLLEMMTFFQNHINDRRLINVENRSIPFSICLDDNYSKTFSKLLDCCKEGFFSVIGDMSL